MIFCHKKDIKQYLGLDKNLDEALQFALKIDLGNLGAGRTEIKGDDLYVSRYAYMTVPEEESLFEAHRVYTDIQIVLSGTERILCADASSLEHVAEDAAHDYTGLKGEASSRFTLGAGNVLILFPGEAHKVKCMVGAPSHVEKVVFKVRAEPK